MSNIVCFGEVLWDVFPTHKKIGGAPLNVALRLHSFQNEVAVISSVGIDKEGIELLQFIKKQGLTTNFIQTNNAHPTSKVVVNLDANGVANYTIEYPCAWDFINLDKVQQALVKKSDAFIFGSLVLRNKPSEKTFKTLLKEATFTVFDVNLRPPHYQLDKLLEFMKVADFIKFNDEELLEIAKQLGSEHTDIESNIQFVSKETNTQHICVTKGAEGAVLYYKKTFFSSEGYPVVVKDTVGAGDSFLATLINGILKKQDPQEVINKACAVGALVAKNEGANPILSENVIRDFMLN